MELQLTILENGFTIHRLPPNQTVPNQVYKSPFYSISKTEDELSIVCTSTTQLNSEKSETSWSCIRIAGSLDFSLTGILAKISAILAEAEISIFAISTFNTDYILVKSERLSSAREALLAYGYTFTP